MSDSKLIVPPPGSAMGPAHAVREMQLQQARLSPNLCHLSKFVLVYGRFALQQFQPKTFDNLNHFRGQRRQPDPSAVRENVPCSNEYSLALILLTLPTKVVINERLGRVLRGAHNPCAFEPFAKSVKCMDFSISKKLL